MSRIGTSLPPSKSAPAKADGLGSSSKIRPSVPTLPLSTTDEVMHKETQPSKDEDIDDVGIRPSVLSGLDEEVLLQARIIKARGKLWTPSLEKLLRQWRRQISTRHRGHALLNAQLTRRNYFVGLPAVLLAAIAASAIFSSFQNCDKSVNLTVFSSNSTSSTEQLSSPECTTALAVRIIAGIFTVLAAIFSGLNMFLNYGATSQQHKNSADSYEALTRTIDEILQSPIPIRNDAILEIQSIRKQYDDVSKGAPSLPPEYNVDLSYNYVADDHTHRESSLRPFAPPSPGEVSSATATKISPHLDDLRIVVENGHEDDEVTLPFDLDAVAPEEITNIRSKQQLYPALAKALQFEMQRLDDHDRSRRVSKEKRRRDKHVHQDVEV